MSTVTPILDTLLHQVLGRRAGLARFTASRTQPPVSAVDRLPVARNSALLPGRTADPRTADQTRVAGIRHAASPQSAATRVDAAGAVAGRAAATTLPPSAQPHVSHEGRLIAALLSRFATESMAASYTQAPLFSGARAPAAQVLAAMLGRQVATSGVFYESHLLKWLDGKYSITRLRQEPQGRINQRGPPSAEAATDGSKPDQMAKTASTAGTARPAGTGTTRADGPGLSAALLAALGGKSAVAPVHASTLAIVRQQLELVSTPVFRWQGLAWPNAPMQWEVHEHGEQPTDETGDQADGGNSRYSTRLRLQMPALGTLEVRIALVGNAVQVHAWAGTAAGRAALAPETPALRRRLERAGFDAASVELLVEESP